VRYEAKLLVVGEGGRGKSSLLKVLRGEKFEADLVTTHGKYFLALSGSSAAVRGQAARPALYGPALRKRSGSRKVE
jgi:GTPase SAR1 family protein